MKTTILRILTAIGAVSTFITGLGAYLNMLPLEYAKIGALVLAAALGLKEIAIIVGDLADDGERNNSYILPALLVCGLCLGLMSCAMRPDGVKTFLSLDGKQWSAVGVEVGKGAVQTALPAYLRERADSAKDVTPVTK